MRCNARKKLGFNHVNSGQVIKLDPHTLKLCSCIVEIRNASLFVEIEEVMQLFVDLTLSLFIMS